MEVTVLLEQEQAVAVPVVDRAGLSAECPGQAGRLSSGGGVGVGGHSAPVSPTSLTNPMVMYACQRWGVTFAQDSYGAYRNRSGRQVGNYQRSASAAAVRPDSQHLQAANGADAVFSDRRLGSQSWNSDSQLQSSRRPDTPQDEASSSKGAGVTPGRPAERAGNVPILKAESVQVHSAVKVPGGSQPLGPHSVASQAMSNQPLGPHSVASQAMSNQALGPHSVAPQVMSPKSQVPQPQHPQSLPQAGARGDGHTFTARPYHPEQQARNSVDEGARNNGATSPVKVRSVKEHISNLERKSSFTSASSSTPSPTTSPLHTANTPTSTSQRWANAVPLPSAHRPPAGGDSHRPPASNGDNGSRVPNSRSVVLTDPHLPKDRPPYGSPGPSAGDSLPPSAGSARPRAYSERTRHVEVSPPVDPRQGHRHATETSDSRTLPGHVRNSSQSSTERPRSTSSPYNRRESAPTAQVPPNAAVIAMVSPRRKSEGNCLPSQAELDELYPPPGPITAGHGRQPSQEELECDQRAKELAKEVAASEKKLSDVLSTDATKSRMKYMDGLFSGPSDMQIKTPVSVRRHQSQGSADSATLLQQRQQVSSPAASQDHPNKRNSLPREYFVSPSKAVLEMEWRRKEETTSDLTKNIHDNEALIRQKEELIDKLHKKLELLKEERKGLQEEIQENEALGNRVCNTVDTKCESRSERDKFHTYIDDLEKIVRLLLNLSGQLARAENAVQGLADDVDPRLKKMTLDKRERLQVKHAEAKQLKEDMDKRSGTVSGFLRQSLSAEELNDYAYFVKMKSKLTIELQELEDKITLGQEQIQELRKSIPEPPASPVPRSSSSVASSSSPPPSPVPLS